ncbi:MAG: polyphosphate kinase 1 [Armatimonadetes bacterium]|nr:MAG: polyphosphate kinase 1 [Armatimonadota bacterium]
MTTTPAPPTPRYVNREISLLDFQERVFHLAESEHLPLLERVKFLAIVSSNLDEFFQVRVAGLAEQARNGITALSPDGLTAQEQLAAITTRATDLQSRIDSLFLKELVPLLGDQGIHIETMESLADADRSYLDQVFEDQIFPILTPLAVDPSHPFPYISNLSLNLAVLVADNEGSVQFARVKIPPNIDRFIRLEDGTRFVPIEQVIGTHLSRLFGGLDVVGWSAFRVTRSADIAVEEEEADDLLAAMESVLRYRQRAAQAVRLEVEAGTTAPVMTMLLNGLELEPASVHSREAPLGLASLWELYGLDRHDLKEEPWQPVTQPMLTEVEGRSPDIFAEIRKGDILVHHPYESFATSTAAFLSQAASDPNVLAIKQTLYRTSMADDPAIGGERAIVRTLMTAAEAGKQVVVLVELKARFDEAANINWAKMLEAAGVHVVYGVYGLKTHSKALLVVRKENGGITRYSHIGTGNYNPKTARLYEDLAFFTADPAVGSDLSELFNLLTGHARPVGYSKILVAPHTLRSGIINRIRQQAALGEGGRILWKINHLVDTEIIDELYAASQAGCSIDLIIRGNCSVMPGIPGLSETITVRSLVGRFLEHSRIYRFGDPGQGTAEYLLGSADMMTRNLDGRVEILVNVSDPRLVERLGMILEVEMDDDMLAWELQGSEWSKVPTTVGIDTHATLREWTVAGSHLDPLAAKVP